MFKGKEFGERSGNRRSERQRKKEWAASESRDGLLNKIWENMEQNRSSRTLFLQYRIENNQGVASEKAVGFEEIYSRRASDREAGENEEEAIAGDKRALSAWLTENYESYSMSLLTAGAVFEELPYLWIVEAADRLFASFGDRELEKEKETDREQKIRRFGARIIQGEMDTCMGMVSITVLEWKDKSWPERILRCLWMEFPGIRDKVTRWLEACILEERLSISKRAAAALGRFAYWDHSYFFHNMAPAMMSKDSISDDMKTARILLSWNRYEGGPEELDKILSGWSNRKNVHYLLTVLLVCAELEDRTETMENAAKQFIQEALKEIRDQRQGEYLNHIFDFFAAGVRHAAYYKAMIKAMYCESVPKPSTETADALSGLLLCLFAADIFLARWKDGEEAMLIKLCFANRETSEQLCFLWRLVWSCEDRREDFCRLLGTYVSLAGKQSCERKLRSFVKIAAGENSTSEVCEDIVTNICKQSIVRFNG